MRLASLRQVKDRVAEVERLAELYGWTLEISSDGDGVKISGRRTDRHPDGGALEFGIMLGFATREETGRAVTLYIDGKPRQAVVMIVASRPADYWTGPLSSLERALDDPQGWTGVESPAPAEVLSS